MDVELLPVRLWMLLGPQCWKVQGALWVPVLGWGPQGSSRPAQQCWLCWHWVSTAARSHPGFALQVLLDEEPRDKLCTVVRQQAMLAISALSTVKVVLEDEMMSLLLASFKSVFFLPPKEELDICLYDMTLKSMDIMLQTLLIRPPASSLPENLYRILQVLLCFTSSQNKVGKERAMERIWRLIGFISTRFHHEPIGKYFQSSQRTTIVLRTLETIRDCCIDDNKNQWAKFTLEVAARDSASWLMDVERILRFLHENLKRSDSTSLLRQSFFLVLKALTNQFPREALISVLTNLPPLDSTTLDMWKVMLSFPMTSEKILQELQNVLEDKRVCRSLQAQPVHTSLLKFAMMHPTENVLSNLRDPEKLLTLLSLNSLPILWLVLRALVMLSETSQMVTDVQVLLPEVMETLQYENTHINMKALTIFKNVIRHLEKKEASHIALALAGRLLPLFNDVSSEVRECSMLLFKDLMESVLWWKKGEMKKTVHRAIIPLLFRMSDNTESVAKVSAVILLACAKFLKWKPLEQLAQTEDIWKIGEYLLKQKRSRVEGYLQQSLTYLEDDQTSLRKTAVKFVAFAAMHSRDLDKEDLHVIITFLRMQCDTHPSIRILAAGTIEILQRQVQQQPASRWARLKALRCWP
ncbi:uncharacterized protein [Anas platyrhynchos]|uniref:uncharacterized protein isoform X1 n=1 Tax=Anas platyrhynchos TaxID=8839 RepID=UPI003AF30F78